MRPREIVRAVTPPIVLSIARKLRPPPPEPAPPPPPFTFDGPYASWEAAAADAGGYDAPGILAKVRAAALKVRSGEIAYEQEGLEFSEPSVKWEMLACLLTALTGSERPHVIDYGGSLGTLYYRHRAFLQGVDWSIVEQPNFAACGAAEFADERLKFFTSLEDALGRGPADLLLCGSALQVIPDPFGLLDRAAAAGIPYLLIDRTPVYDVDQDTIVVIRVSAAVNEGSYPYRQFARLDFERQLAEAGYEVIQRYERDNRPGWLCRLSRTPTPRCRSFSRSRPRSAR